MAEPIIQEFIPRGGMNQDDSIVSPTPGLESAVSLFANGDYRYALNARIGSSRHDSFGDVENMRGTLEVTAYRVREQIMSNSDFEGSLDDWLQTDDGLLWIYGIDKARLNIVPDSITPTLFYNITSFQAPANPSWPAANFTQANFPEAGTFLTGTVVHFTDSVFYGSGFLVEVGAGYFVFQHTFNGNESGVKVAYGSGPPEYIPTDFTSNVIYQVPPNTIGGVSNGISAHINVEGVVSGGVIYLVLMNGGTIVEERQWKVGINENIFLYEVITLPANVTGIGIRVTGQVSNVSSVDIYYLRDNISVVGVKPAGNEKVIGKYEDREFNRLFYHVYNDQGNHCIRYYEPKDNVIVELMKWEGLNYQPDFFVDSDMLDNWMAITDRNNAPRLIDVNTISDLLLRLGDDFREYHISFHKWAPIAPPIVRLTIQDVGPFRFRGKGVFQFSFRYIYFGGLRSRWSPVSTAHVEKEKRPTEVRQYNINVHLPGTIYDEQSNTFFGHDSVKFLAAVEYIEIGFRRGRTDLWKLWKRVRTDELPESLSWDFYNDEYVSVIADDDFFHVFDNVPFKAGTVVAIDNRFMFGDILDEQPAANTPIIADTVVYKEIFNEWNNSNAPLFTSLTLAQQNEYVARNSRKEFTFKARGQYRVSIQYLHPSGWRSLGYSADNWLYTLDQVNSFSGQSLSFFTEPNQALGFRLDERFIPPEWAVAYQFLITNCINIDYFIIGIANKFDFLIDSARDVTDKATMPESLRNTINLYFDNNQNITSSELNELQKGNTLWSRIMANVRRTQTTTTLASASRLYIDVNNWYNAAKANAAGNADYPANNILYDYRNGDRVRFVGSNVSNPTANQKIIYDEIILEYTGQGIIVAKPQGLLWLPSRPSGDYEDFFVEVYRPKTEQITDFVYHEIGEWYPITNPGTVNRDFSKRDFTWGGKSQVTATEYGSGASKLTVFHKVPIYFGDTHFLYKDQTYRHAFYTDHPSPSFFSRWASMNPFELYEIWERNAGREAQAYSILPTVTWKPTQVRFGGKIIEDSLVNNLNRFRFDDQETYPSEYGRIRKLVNTNDNQVESVGVLMLAIGEREAWSIYINRKILQDLTGNQLLTLSDRVLGSFNKLLGSHGTLNPESVSVERGRVYWWDPFNGTWVRYGRNGLTALSDYKMRNWFKQLSEIMINGYYTGEKPVALSEFDTFNEELVTFHNHSSLPATFRDYADYKGALFSENDTRWKSIHNYEPEMMGKLNTLLMSFKDGRLFLHEQTDNHGEFYGEQYDTKIEPVFNTNPINMKVWQALGIVATEKWSVERLLSEYRGQRQKQASILPLVNFVEKEDSWWADVLRNQNTPVISNPLIEGDAMRSRAVQVLLKLDPEVTTRTLLYYVLMGYNASPKNP